LLGELNDYFVKREEFVNRLAQLQLDQNNEAQFFLRRIERFYNPEGMEINKPKFVNTEHIYPQTPGSNWDPLTTPANVLRIGNLTLCDSKINKKLGNKKWEEKVRIWKERDSAKVYKLVNLSDDNGPGIDFELKKWDDAEIENRSQRLSEICFDILLQPVYELVL
ncbi:HNH endonuclease family protein, partial [Candidatus Poseidoniaceae archaeon]|nr:HNH endonuclease family protein [Candidatus Poseidoniaceae archaeon]